MPSSFFYAIGLMSGTSMDGVDAVLLKTDGEYQNTPLGHVALPYPQAFYKALKQQTHHAIDPAVIQQSTDFHLKAVKKLCQTLPLALKKKIQLIGYHGQTIYHNPREKISLQIGYPQKLAHATGLPVVYDFRSQDIQHGGQGAPLAPLYHHARMKQKGLDKLAVINCGGIANISVMDSTGVRAGFDTGPGNVLIDQFVRKMAKMTNQKKINQKKVKVKIKEVIDKDGRFSQKGTIDENFLKILYQKTTSPNFYEKLPPKSLDSRDICFIPEIAEHFENRLYDGCATLAAFTAMTLAQGFKIAENMMPSLPENTVVCGGGAKNPSILKNLQYFLPAKTNILTAEALGWHTASLEAELIAWLAVRSKRGLPLTVPEITGVSTPVTGGKWVYPTI